MPYVRDREVVDLGCYNLVHCHMLVEHGATKVIGIDRNRTSAVSEYPYHIEVRQQHFEDFHDPVDVAFMSWPVNWQCGLAPIARRANTVIYLGSNMSGSACGDPTLFEVLRQRENPVYIPDFKNTLAIYGPNMVDREANPEERAVLEERDRVLSYWEEHNPWEVGNQVTIIGEDQLGIIKSFEGECAMVLWAGESEPRPASIRSLRQGDGRYRLLTEDQSAASVR